MTYPFVESPNRTPSPGRQIATIVIHTMEIAERKGAARSCAAWFARPDSQVSAHYCVDADEVVQCVREEDIAWHARGGNSSSIGVELAGAAGQDPIDWSDPYSAAVLRRAASLVAEVCARHGIPVRRIGPNALQGNARGITGHADVSLAFRKSDHWDPGPAFPWEGFLRLVREARAQAGARSRPDAAEPGRPRLRPGGADAPAEGEPGRRPAR